MTIDFGCLATQAVGQDVPSNAPFTLHTGTRLVLTDITVTDRNGRPIAGLPRSAFRIFDNGHEEVLTNFEEHRPELRARAAPFERNVASNAYFEPPPAVSNVLLIDIDTLGALDQMYLAEELKNCVQALPAGESIAIYVCDSLTPRLLQDFTADQGKLLTAVQLAVPHFRQADAQYASDMSALMGMVAQLRDLPGRKNLLWFSGGSTLAISPDASTLPAAVDMRPVYDALESSQVAVYPIEARGLTLTDGGGAIPWQHMVMEETAEATGGRAIFNDNGLSPAASRTVAEGQSFYTLTYSAHEPKFDSKWHKVKVEVDHNTYELSYRRGYYDDQSSVKAPPKPGRLRLLADGSTTRITLESPVPIVFRAIASPSSGSLDDRAHSGSAVPPTALPKMNEMTYAVRFQLPVSALSLQPFDGRIARCLEPRSWCSTA